VSPPLQPHVRAEPGRGAAALEQNCAPSLTLMSTTHILPANETTFQQTARRTAPYSLPCPSARPASQRLPLSQGSYPYTANAPSGYPFTQPVGGANCSGVVTVTPCPAAPISLACANLRLNLSAAPTGCQLSVVAAKADLATVVGASADDVAISWAGAAPATVPGSSNFSFTAGESACKEGQKGVWR
jgi:hypothetical protein